MTRRHTVSAAGLNIDETPLIGEAIEIAIQYAVDCQLKVEVWTSTKTRTEITAIAQPDGSVEHFI